jgi:hypothetical protein
MTSTMEGEAQAAAPSAAQLARNLARAVRDAAIDEMVLRATLILLLLHGATSPSAAIVIRVVGGLMLICEPLLRQPLLWGILAVTVAASNAVMWELIDNHKFLITYWTVACIIATRRDTSVSYLADTARRLTAIVFLWAAMWKLIAGQYSDGSFLYVTALTDSRVVRLAAMAADVPYLDVETTRQAVEMSGQAALEGFSIPLLASPALWGGAIVASWLTIVGEAAVGMLHLLRSHTYYYWRHGVLLGFIAVTYALLPVTPFGFILAVMGLSQCASTDRRLKAIYLVALACVQVTLFPWQTLLPLK